MDGVQDAQATEWYYEQKGERRGAVTEEGLIKLIKEGVVAHGSLVWKSGLTNWEKIENTDLSVHLGEMAPPPLTGESVNNTVVWILAFAPMIGYFMEWFVAGMVYGGYNFESSIAMQNAKFWYVTLILNIVLALVDEQNLKKAGHNTSSFRGWVWLVPVYLYQRAKATQQNYAYFVVWLVMFGLTWFM